MMRKVINSKIVLSLAVVVSTLGLFPGSASAGQCRRTYQNYDNSDGTTSVMVCSQCESESGTSISCTTAFFYRNY